MSMQSLPVASVVREALIEEDARAAEGACLRPLLRAPPPVDRHALLEGHVGFPRWTKSERAPSSPSRSKHRYSSRQAQASVAA